MEEKFILLCITMVKEANRLFIQLELKVSIEKNKLQIKLNYLINNIYRKERKMKKNLLYISIMFLGVSMIISSFILSMAIKEGNQLYGSLNGSLSGSFSMSDSSSKDNDILIPYDAGQMLGYDQDALIIDIENGKLEGIPYAKFGNSYIFSKKALEEWIYSKTLE